MQCAHVVGSMLHVISFILLGELGILVLLAIIKCAVAANLDLQAGTN